MILSLSSPKFAYGATVGFLRFKRSLIFSATLDSPIPEKLRADWAIAISGIAGPSGGSKDKPVGLVYISISGPDNHITNIKKLFNSTRNRIEIQRLSVNVCLNSLRLILLSNSK